jgi:membrane protease YdiL (CAAX protease family)
MEIPPRPPSVPPLPEPHVAPELGEVPWRAREGFAVAGLAFVSGLFLSLILFAAMNVKTGTQRATTYLLAAGVLTELTFGFWAWAWIRLRFSQGLARLGVRRGTGNIRAGLIAGVVGLVASYAVMATIVPLLDKLIHGPIKPKAQLPTIHSGVQTTMAIFLVVIAAPLGEELLFRGFLYQAFRRWKGVMAGSALSAIVFGLVHTDFTDFFGGIAHVDAARVVSSILIVFPTAILGFILAQTFERRGSIIPCMVAHGAYNLVGVLIILRYG